MLEGTSWLVGTVKCPNFCHRPNFSQNWKRNLNRHCAGMEHVRNAKFSPNFLLCIVNMLNWLIKSFCQYCKF